MPPELWSLFESAPPLAVSVWAVVLVYQVRAELRELRARFDDHVRQNGYVPSGRGRPPE